MICVLLSGSLGVETGDSAASSPMMTHRQIPDELSVGAFKKVLEGPTPREREDDEARKKRLHVSGKLL